MKVRITQGKSGHETNLALLGDGRFGPDHAPHISFFGEVVRVVKDQPAGHPCGAFLHTGSAGGSVWERTSFSSRLLVKVRYFLLSLPPVGGGW